MSRHEQDQQGSALDERGPDNQDPDSPQTGNRKKDKPRRRLNVAYIFLFMFVGLVLINYRSPVDSIKCTPDIIDSKPDVVMLSAWWCGYCYKARRYFHDNGIDYCEYDMENHPTGISMYEQNGGGAIPLLMIGEYTLRGYSEQQIETALSLLRQVRSDTEDKID